MLMKNYQTQLGFSTGVFYKLPLSLAEKIEVIRKAGCRVIELGFIREKELLAPEAEAAFPAALRSFQYVSIHAPNFAYGRNQKTKKIFSRITCLAAKRHVDTVVFHPDQIADFAIFDAFPCRIALENMDPRKNDYQKAEEFKQVFQKHPSFRLVLDINHLYANDPTLSFVKAYQRLWRKKIVEIHLSGYAGLHEPLFQTKQRKILEAIASLKVPLIIESLLAKNEIKWEATYIRTTIRKILQAQNKLTAR